jgi:hypothetical protein
MSDAKGNSRSTTPQREREVLVNLPHTRPQRTSPRRAAARKAAAGTSTERRTPARPATRSRLGGGTAQTGGHRAATARATAGPAAGEPKSTPRQSPPNESPPRQSPPKQSAPRRASSPRRRDAAPRQGFESDGENMNGSIQPPGGAELVASAAEIVGELAKVGLSAGERLLKDAFSRLPRS